MKIEFSNLVQVFRAWFCIIAILKTYIMKTKYFFSIFILSAALILSACNGSKKSTSTENAQASAADTQAKPAETAAPETKPAGNTVAVAPAETEPKEQVKPGTFRFIVSFISIGSGSDMEAMKKFEEYIASFQEKNKTKLELKKIGWGREGEVDWCFHLKDMSAEKQSEFIAGAKKLFSGNELVLLSENDFDHLNRQ